MGDLGFWERSAYLDRDAGTHGPRCQSVGDAGGQVFGFPRWSPDGTSLVYTTLNGDIQVRTISINDGSSQVVATSPAEDTWADWSADGARIVFGGTSDLPDGLYVVNADGSNSSPLLKGYRLGDVFWIN